MKLPSFPSPLPSRSMERSGISTACLPFSGFAERATRFHKHAVLFAEAFVRGLAHAAASAKARGMSAKKSALLRTTPAISPACIAGAGEEVAPRRADDRRSGVLRDHQPPERLSVEGGQRRRVDEEGRAECVQQPVDRHGTAGRQRHFRRSDRTERRIVDRRVAKEDVGAVLPQDLVDAVRISREPGSYRLHRHLAQRNLADIGEDFSRAGKALAGFGGIGDAAQASRRPCASRAAP